MSDQPQPVRTGDVYPPSASAHDARRQRDEVLGTHGGDQQQNQDGDLRVTEAARTTRRETRRHRHRRRPGAAWRRRQTRDHRRLCRQLARASGDSSGPRRPAAVQSAEAARRGSTRHPRGGVASAAGAETNMRPGLGGGGQVRLMGVLSSAAAVMPDQQGGLRRTVTSSI
ncbi:hypothetical protein ZWY2020_008385 [Hordeum vulgare]|nr:hypothetical protein ZWY2020_008385 [Hordeum vulgare]